MAKYTQLSLHHVTGVTVINKEYQGTKWTRVLISHEDGDYTKVNLYAIGENFVPVAQEGTVAHAFTDAAGALPTGWRLDVSVERGRIWVDLFNAEGEQVVIIDDRMSLLESIQTAVKIAVSK